MRAHPANSAVPNLHVDISWVVWEDVICDDKGVVKPPWVKCIEKHNERFYIGSDNVAQYFPISDLSTNLLAMNITKCAPRCPRNSCMARVTSPHAWHTDARRYWQLFDKLSPAAAENVAYKNAYRMYFEKWDVPSGSRGDRRYAKIDPVYESECLDPDLGTFAPFTDSSMGISGMY